MNLWRISLKGSLTRAKVLKSKREVYMTQTEYNEKIEKVESQIKACEEKLAGLKERLKTLKKRQKEDEMKEIRQRQQSIGAVVEELLSNEEGFFESDPETIRMLLEERLAGDIQKKEVC